MILSFEKALFLDRHCYHAHTMSQLRFDSRLREEELMQRKKETEIERERERYLESSWTF
jgi:hypothetical protein